MQLFCYAFIPSKGIVFVNFIKYLMCFFIKSLLLVGQSFVFSIDCFKIFLPLFKSLHSNIMWSIFWSRFPQGQVGAFIILKRCKYEFVMYVCMYVCMCLCIYVCVCVYIYICTHTRVHTYLHAYIHTYKIVQNQIKIYQPYRLH